MSDAVEARDTRLRRSLRNGILWWVLFSMVAVVLRGVRWDEDYEYAQAMLGLVPYDPGHPLFICARGLYSVQTHSLALLMRFWHEPALPNGLRNVLFLMATTIPVFVLTMLVARRALVGHIAVAIVLMGGHAAFYGSYPAFVWPSLYSNGHIGTGWALATVAVLASRYWPAGVFLAGCMPMIHLGQWPPVMLLALLRMGYEWRHGNTSALRQSAMLLLAGIAACAVFAGFHFWQDVPPATSGPYASNVSSGAVLTTYMDHFASHRAMPWGTGHLLLAGTPLLLAPLARYERQTRNHRGARGWLLLYAILIAVIVWGTMVIHGLLGTATPHILLAWMPYRLLNHMGPLLLAVSVACLSRALTKGNAKGRKAAVVLLATILVVGTWSPLLESLLPRNLFGRYLADGSWSVFVLWGAALACARASLTGDPAFSKPWAWITLAAFLGLAWVHQFGAACVAVGYLAVSACPARSSNGEASMPSNGLAGKLLGALTVLLIASLLLVQWRTREHLPISKFEKEVQAFLSERGDSQAMILPRFHQESLQARTGHPVMTDMASLPWIPYRPSIGPAFHGMYRDLYGLDLAPPAGVEPMPTAWHEVWPAKSAAEWKVLSRKYGFRYVLAPAFMDLPLEVGVEGEHERLYIIEPEVTRNEKG